MKKQFSKKKVIAIFKNLDNICKEEIRFHKENFRVCNEDYGRNKKLYEEQQNFILGLEQVRKYVIKQYFDKCVKPIEEDELLIPCTYAIQRGKHE